MSTISGYHSSTGMVVKLSCFDVIFIVAVIRKDSEFNFNAFDKTETDSQPLLIRFNLAAFNFNFNHDQDLSQIFVVYYNFALILFWYEIKCFYYKTKYKKLVIKIITNLFIKSFIILNIDY